LQLAQYKGNFEAEQKRVAELIKTIEPERKLYERHKRDCASKDPYDRMACGRRMRYNWGYLEREQAKLNEFRAREQTALNNMNAEKRNLDGSERQLATTRGELNSTGLQIGRTENAIVSVRRSLSDVRDLVQPFRIVSDEFANALNEAKDVSLADERPRTLRKLGDIAAGVDATMARGRDAVSRVDKTLGAGWMKSCRVS